MNELETTSITGLEIFSTGSWNGDNYSAEDLDAMVHAFDKVGFRPQVKAGHERGQEDEDTRRRVFGMPSLGSVNRIYRNGKTLLADIINIPKRFSQLIKTRTFSRVSSEIYWNYKDESNGKTFPRVLKAIAFLGAEVPALTSLKEIEALFTVTDNGVLKAYDSDGQMFRAYDLKIYQGDTMEIRDEGGKFCVYNEAGDKVASFDSREEAEAYVAKRGKGALEETPPKPFASVQEVKDYIIRKRGSQWCVLTHDGEKVLGCHDTEEKAKAQLRAVEASKRGYSENGQFVWITLKEMENLCPSCADNMRQKNFSRVRVYLEGPGTDINEGAVSALCEKFGESEGFRTRCMPWAEEKGIADPGGFCNDLKTQCNFSDSQEAKEISTVARFDKEPAKGGRQMTDEEFESKMKEREAQQKQELIKEFQYRIDKAREEGKAEAERENEVLRESITKLQREKRSDRIEHWIKNLKSEGKLLPVEESRVRALRMYFNDDEETQLKYFAIKEGKPTEFKDTPVKIFESIFNDRRLSLFKQVSTEDGSVEDQEQELSDPGAEVHRRVTVYQQRQGEKNISVNYGDALRYVLAQDQGLAKRYNASQQ